MPECRQSTSFRFWLIGTWICWMVLGCAGQAVRSDLTKAERREDLAYLAGVFAEREQSFTAKSRAAFETRLAAVQSEVASMSHDAFIAGIQWAVAAAVNERHSAAAGNLEPEVSIPLTFADYAAGRNPVMATLPSLVGAASP